MLLCLAHSRRPGGRCVAGKIWANGNAGAWVRPVHPNNGNANSPADTQYEDGSQSDVLDIIKIRMNAKVPNGHQRENEAIDSDEYWEKVGRAGWADVVRATDNIAGPLFGQATSSYHGTNDQITPNVAAGLKRSLVLIDPQNLRLDVDDESLYGGGSKRRVRARFSYSNIPYALVVTDPVFESEYMAQPNGVYPIPAARICVSLAEIKNGSATMLAASIFTPQRV